ncbi:MAG: ribonuclease III [Rickettsiales bacterium]
MKPGFESVIHYTFSDAALLKSALTHRSLDKKANNQRLEFLGDRVLGLVVCDMLYHAFPSEQEGELARRHAALVCKELVAEVASALQLGHYIILSSSEESSGGRNNISNLEDACEALIGAIYLDGGFAAAQDFIERMWRPRLESIAEPPKDPKTSLQEWAQARALGLPLYEIVTQTGPAHAPEFVIRVKLDGKSSEATAASKRAAEQLAAKKLLDQVLSA